MSASTGRFLEAHIVSDVEQQSLHYWRNVNRHVDGVGSDSPHSYTMLRLEEAANLFPICDVVTVILGDDLLDELITFWSCYDI